MENLQELPNPKFGADNVGQVVFSWGDVGLYNFVWDFLLPLAERNGYVLDQEELDYYIEDNYGLGDRVAPRDKSNSSADIAYWIFGDTLEYLQPLIVDFPNYLIRIADDDKVVVEKSPWV